MKRLWVFFALVVIPSFVVLSWIGTRIHEEAPPIASMVLTTARWLSTPVRFKPAKMSGNRWAAWKSARSGDTAAMSHRIGPPIGCIGKRSSFSTAGPLTTSEPNTNLDNEKQSQLSGRLATLMRANTYDPQRRRSRSPRFVPSVRVKPGPLLRCVRQR